MSLTDCLWIRCNFCVIPLSSRQLYLTFCGHIFCLPCLGKDVKLNSLDCPAPGCGSKTQASEINQKLGPSKMMYFKNIDKEFSETKKKYESILAFQNYHCQKTIKLLSMKVKKFSELKEQYKKKEDVFKEQSTSLSTSLRSVKEQLKKKEDEVTSLKNLFTKASRQIEKYKDNEKRIMERMRKLERASQQGNKENPLLARAKIDQNNLKRRRDRDGYDRIVKQKSSDSNNLVQDDNLNYTKLITQPARRRQKSPCLSLRSQNYSETQGERFKTPVVPRLANSGDGFLFGGFKDNDTENFKFDNMAQDESINMDNFNFDASFNSNPRQRFHPLSTSTQRNGNLPPTISQDASLISEIPMFRN